jgi:hypothetical protein
MALTTVTAQGPQQVRSRDVVGTTRPSCCSSYLAPSRLPDPVITCLAMFRVLMGSQPRGGHHRLYRG